jgi:pyridoxal/pyridoxine/pyridoxamine kinase
MFLRLRILSQCEQVLGDDGKCYCPPHLVERFKQQLLPQAFIITPNAFEAQLLTGTRYRPYRASCSASRVILQASP